MSQYIIEFECSKEKLLAIANAHKRACLIKQTDEQSDVSPVAWCSFKPWRTDIKNGANNSSIFSYADEIESDTSIKKPLNDSLEINSINIHNTEKFCLMTESGELISKELNIPEGLLEEAKNVSLIYNEVNEEFYLDVE